MAARDKSAPSNKVPEIRTGDTVVVLHGKDAGKRGKVERVLRNPSTERKAKIDAGRRRPAVRSSVVISGINIAKRHTKPRQKMQNDRAPQVQQGGIVDKPMPIDASNVMIVCPRCDRPDARQAPAPEQRQERPRVRALQRAAGGGRVSGSLRQRYYGRGRPGAAEAVRLRQPDADPARLQDRGQHRSGRGASRTPRPSMRPSATSPRSPARTRSRPRRSARSRSSGCGPATRSARG